MRTGPDVWHTPVSHPLAGTGTRLNGYVPYPATVTAPLTVGGNPMTWEPMQVRLWDEDGAGSVHVQGPRGCGRSVLRSVLAERVTACLDAVLLEISPRRPGPWEPAWSVLCGASATRAPDVTRILRFADEVIQARSRSGRPARIHRPTPGEPLYVLAVDEVSALDRGETRWLLQRILTGCRSAGVAVTTYDQRDPAWRPQSTSVISTVLRAHPGTAPGVFDVIDRPSGDSTAGRVFDLSDPDDQDFIVARRIGVRPPHEMEPALEHLQPLWDEIQASQDGHRDRSGR